MADNLVRDKIHCPNLTYSGLSPSLVVGSLVENDIVIDMVVVDESCKAVGIWRCNRLDF
jgi:hypothetical protein